MNIRWTLDALNDYRSILEQAAERNTLEAANIAWRVERAELNIGTFPKAAFHNKPRDYYERYIPNTRIILIYKIEAPDVIILAAFHTSRSASGKP
jgi:plasmid stabilization system protein ParE